MPTFPGRRCASMADIDAPTIGVVAGAMVIAGGAPRKIGGDGEKPPQL